MGRIILPYEALKLQKPLSSEDLAVMLYKLNREEGIVARVGAEEWMFLGGVAGEILKPPSEFTGKYLVDSPAEFNMKLITRPYDIYTNWYPYLLGKVNARFHLPLVAWLSATNNTEPEKSDLELALLSSNTAAYYAAQIGKEREAELYGRAAERMADYASLLSLFFNRYLEGVKIGEDDYERIKRAVIEESEKKEEGVVADSPSLIELPTTAVLDNLRNRDN